MTAIKTEKNLGRITQIIGPVLDVAFAPNKMPNIYNAIVVEGKNDAGEDLRIVAEVQQLLGDNLVRAVSMSATDGLMRGMTVVDTGSALAVPVGKTTLGRIFNVLGDPVDELGPCGAEASRSASAPSRRSRRRRPARSQRPSGTTAARRRRCWRCGGRRCGCRWRLA